MSLADGSAPDNHGDPAAGNSAAAVGAGQPSPAASYEQARDELAQVVARLETGGLSLDESLTLWERGEHLAAECARFLDGARERVDAALARAEDRARAGTAG